MNQTDRKCLSPVSKPENFWKTIKLYLDIPHTVNKRLAGTVPISYFKTTNDISLHNFIELREYLRNEGDYNGDSVINFLKQKHIDVVKCPGAVLEHLTDTLDVTLQRNKILILRKVLPKNKTLYENANELVLIGMQFNPSITRKFSTFSFSRFHITIHNVHNSGCR